MKLIKDPNDFEKIINTSSKQEMLDRDFVDRILEEEDWN